MNPSYWHQPNIDPVLLHLWGPFQIRWYSLLYVGGFLAAREVAKRYARESRFEISTEGVEQMIAWLLIGAVVGARVFYCVVYDPWNLLANPFYLFQVYRGGLSFHGGFMGVGVAAYLFARKNDLSFWNLVDLISIASPVGLAMGRIGNFINGELYGRPTNVPWAMIFRDGGPVPRHPSQLYEFFLEGILLFLFLAWARKRLRKNGQLTMAFLFGYSVCRFIVEFFREPDAQLGYLALGLTMGQILSILFALIAVGAGYYFSQAPDGVSVTSARKQ